MLGSSLIKIRTLRKGDQEVYVSVHNKGYSTEVWFGALEKAIMADDLSKLKYDATFLAEVDNKVVGLVDIKTRGQLTDIENIVVLSEYRRRGIGNALLEKAIEFSASRKLKQIRAEVPDQSKGAIGFYTENFFRELTNAYLIDVRDKSTLERIGLCICPVESTKENTRFWVPDEEQMKLIRRSKARFSIVGKFRVMTRNVRNDSHAHLRAC